MPNRLHSAKVAATGGCNGLIRSNDGLLDLELACPRGFLSQRNSANEKGAKYEYTVETGG
jgi:hypothetical protein